MRPLVVDVRDEIFDAETAAAFCHVSNEFLDAVDAPVAKVSRKGGKRGRKL